eukprot:TRINITY_DN23872_c0_g1_i1.p3 TRINITY_DN23872_c0_g1~~TRINITY_DN23872_c0_g1_i1.p3  ORF type:complete len:108 (-),score=3.30 TRINITY_DN23872_c0_g1_i1:246-569(-)
MNDYVRKRSELLHQLANVPPFLRGSITCVCAKCSRAKCICVAGPVRRAYRLTYKNDNQKTQTVYVPEYELERVQQLIANYHQFRKLAEQLVAVNVEVFKEECHRRKA